WPQLRLIYAAVSRPDPVALHRVHLASRAHLSRLARSRALGRSRSLPAPQRRDHHLRIGMGRWRPSRGSRVRFRNRAACVAGNQSYAELSHRSRGQPGAAIAMNGAPRIALFADTFHEVNGAARTCREWYAFARRRELPFLCIRRGAKASFREDGPMSTLELVRSRLSLPIDPDLRFAARFLRHLDEVEGHVRRFRPDFVHITSPGDLGILGAAVAARLKVPLAASWHTNLHEFAARRIVSLTSWMPGSASRAMAGSAERFVMDRVCWFFRRAQVIFAPNPELARILHERTGRTVAPMGRGIDTGLFHPSRRDRTDSDLVLGYVGRLMPEKNLRLLPAVAAALRAAGIERFRFQITGSGSERVWLERNLTCAHFTGVLTGEALACAYANCDIFLFP